VEALLITGRRRARSKINWLTRDRVELVIDRVRELVQAIVQELELEPEIVLVEAELTIVLAAVEPELALVAVVPALGQVAGVLVHDQAVPVLGFAPVVVKLVQVAVQVEIKSAIAAHHHGLLLLAGEDLAVGAVETSLEPVAIEAVIAWGAVGLAAAAAVAGVVVAAAVAEDGDKRAMRKNK
jgi:hypothetical protein